MKELDPPPMAQSKSAFEVLRVWTAEGESQECVLQTAWEDPAAWGLLIVDIARHAARAYANTTQLTEQQALERIRMGLDAEWNSPTDPGRQVYG
jgi:hypothetical protein